MAGLISCSWDYIETTSSPHCTHTHTAACHHQPGTLHRAVTESVRKARIVTVSVEWPLLGETRLLGWTEHPATPLADTADNVRPGAQASCPSLPYIYLCRHCHPTANLDLAILHLSHCSIAHSERILTIPNSFLSILIFDSSIGWACIHLSFPPFRAIRRVYTLSSVLDDPLQVPDSAQHVFAHPCTAHRSFCVPGLRSLADPERPGRVWIASLRRFPGYEPCHKTYTQTRKIF
jgi:hypothetical protein